MFDSLTRRWRNRYPSKGCFQAEHKQLAFAVVRCPTKGFSYEDDVAQAVWPACRHLVTRLIGIDF